MSMCLTPSSKMRMAYGALRPAVGAIGATGAIGDGATREEAVADLRLALTALIAEV
jgi:hypothetical protein